MQKEFPHVLVIASALGFYGDGSEAIVEKATAAAAMNGIPVQRPVISEVVTNLQFTRILEK